MIEMNQRNSDHDSQIVRAKETTVDSAKTMYFLIYKQDIVQLVCTRYICFDVVMRSHGQFFLIQRKQ